MQLSFGDRKKITFSSVNDKYEAIGFLAGSKYTSLTWENNENSGAWGSEGRIHCYSDLNKFPTAFSNRFSAGNGRILERVNCNEFLSLLVNTHSFALGDLGVGAQNIARIRNTIPVSYQVDFDRGLAI